MALNSSHWQELELAFKKKKKIKMYMVDSVVQVEWVKIVPRFPESVTLQSSGVNTVYIKYEYYISSCSS